MFTRCLVIDFIKSLKDTKMLVNFVIYPPFATLFLCDQYSPSVYHSFSCPLVARSLFLSAADACDILRTMMRVSGLIPVLNTSLNVTGQEPPLWGLIESLQGIDNIFVLNKIHFVYEKCQLEMLCDKSGNWCGIHWCEYIMLLSLFMSFFYQVNEPQKLCS